MQIGKVFLTVLHLLPPEVITCLVLSLNRSFVCHFPTLKHTALSFSFLVSFSHWIILQKYARMQLPACLIYSVHSFMLFSCSANCFCLLKKSVYEHLTCIPPPMEMFPHCVFYPIFFNMTHFMSAPETGLDVAGFMILLTKWSNSWKTQHLA